MLRVVPSANAAAANSYYSSGLAREDYYAQGQEIVGRWHGRAAEMLGLDSGKIAPGEFGALVDNRHPVTGEKLTVRTRADRLCGYDLNFHAPKSLSVLQSLTSDENLVRVFREAVAETMTEIEKQTETRVRRNGRQEDRVTGNLAWAEFVHFTARPVGGIPDPHLHVHCFTFNCTFDVVESRWKAAKFHRIKGEAPLHEAAFHARLSKKVADLGYSVRRTKGAWEVVGIPDSVIDKFSRRTAEIEKIASAKGITNSKLKDALGAKTRAGKRKGMTHADLLGAWGAKLHDDEKVAIFRTHDEKPRMKNAVKVTAGEALDFADAKLFEKNAVVAKQKILFEALRYGVGHVHPDAMQREFAKRGYIEREIGGEVLVTTGMLMVEEAELIQRIREGRGKHAPLFPGRLHYSHSFLSREQREAVRHVLRSNDQVIALHGIAGSGKTTLMLECSEQLAKQGMRVFAFAQSAAASRGVLREKGFADADTIARLLIDKNLQLQVRGQVIFIDEAGLVGTRDLARIIDIVGLSTRVILVGDTLQHVPVARGDALRLLKEYSGMSVASVQEIQRQGKKNKESGYRKAVIALSRGDVKTGFAKLEEIGAVDQITDDAERYRFLASEYYDTLKATGHAPLVVSPTHAESHAVTAAIREKLREVGKIGESRKCLQYRPLRWEEAEKQKAENYTPGLMIQFHQNAKGIKRGSILPVVEGEGGHAVWLGLPGDGKILLDFKEAGKYQIFEKASIELAKGDLVKITRNGNSANGHRIYNDTVLPVKKIGADGTLTLANNVVLAPDWGHIAHGFCGTSHSSQGKTTDAVFVAQSSMSFRAGSAEQFYVSVSRGRENIRVFTDDRLELQRAVGNTSRRISALEFGGISKEAFMTPGLDGVAWTKRVAANRGNMKDATQVEKLLAQRHVNLLKKPENSDFRTYIDMRRKNAGPDGRSRSKGSGPSKAKQHHRGSTVPKRVELRQEVIDKVSKPATKPKEGGKPKPVARAASAARDKIAKGIETAKGRLKGFMEKNLPPKSTKAPEGHVAKVGKVTIKAKDLNSDAAKKRQVEQKVKQAKPKKEQAAKQVKAPTPPVRRR
ncbi:MAG: MobF family relaxase [Verrucomicrobiota bacterium]